ncbi:MULTISPECIES: pyridoxal phosphate-dependent aminotransferase [Apibacter]|uniref:pyridoxal phosphate-dependent aminotransferase n=1 Tax=Apibacter TaxID=1778601 RepID=UPI001C69AA5B|nr:MULTISPECIES: pyridoxal phosphate-dependent aminotransferase [Apibacter]QYN51015.1 pyridoxal phosphate-dependent aminotransferase [Apibacter sp. ESL0404]
MPKFSSRGLNMPESPIRKLAPYAVKAKEKGLHVYHLNIGQPDIKSPQTSIDVLKNIDIDIYAYTPSEGKFDYRETLKDYYHSLGFNDLTRDNFIITNGGSEALSFSLSCLCDHGDEIIVPEPFYANYYSFAESIGVTIVPIVSTIDTGFSLPDIEKFEEVITPKTRAILITNPSNPTGYLYSREELQKLADIAIKHDIFLISDEVYREYVYDGLTFHSVLNFPELKDNVIVVDSESKRYSLCGIRCGFLVTRNTKFLEIALKFAQARLSPSLIGQIIANAAHKQPLSYIENVRKEYSERRDLLVKLLNDIPGVICPNPKGSFYCTVELPVDNAEDFCLWMLKDFEYENGTVMLTPAQGFYSNQEHGKKQVRLAYVINKDDIAQSIKIIKKGLEKYNSLQ